LDPFGALVQRHTLASGNVLNAALSRHVMPQ
jgi:hypothetical protein